MCKPEAWQQDKYFYGGKTRDGWFWLERHRNSNFILMWLYMAEPWHCVRREGLCAPAEEGGFSDVPWNLHG